MNDSELLWFCDYLFNRTQVVEVDQSHSDPHPLLSGVPQGSILGPLLFLIYFNDLPDCLTKAKVIMYADDTVLYFASDKTEKIQFSIWSSKKYLNKLIALNYLYLKKGKTESICLVRQRNFPKNLNHYKSSIITCLLYTSPSPRDATLSRMPSSA